MSQTVLTQSYPMEGPWPQPVAHGRFGIYDQCRQQETVVPGMAASWKDSTSPADRVSYYKFGNVLARPKFAGLVCTTGNGPSLQSLASTTDSDGSAILFAGLGAALLAPGETCKRGQMLEPIPSGVNQAYFRVASGGHGVLEARQCADNATGTEPIMISVNVLHGAQASGLLGPAVGPSAALVGVTAETAYGPAAAATVTIPANSLRVGDRLRIATAVLSGNIAAGANTVKGRINGIAGALLFTAPAVTFAASDVVQYVSDLYVSAIGGSGNLSQAGSVSAGTPGTATARALAGQIAIDTTVANVVTITNTPNNVADTSNLLFLSVEKMG